MYNYTFLDAVKELADRAGIKINFEKKVNFKKDDNVYKILELSAKWFEENLKLENSECFNYLSKRGITDETIKLFRLGYSYNQLNLQYYHLLAQLKKLFSL